MEVELQRHNRFSDEHPVSEIVHSCQDMRVILINLLPGQVLPPHTSSSSVSLQIVAGRGELLNGCDWVEAETGTLRFYPSGEPHGIRATTEPLSVLATLAPRP
ncbi:MAG: cupin domain-containing protein [Mycobacterium leprae]